MYQIKRKTTLTQQKQEKVQSSEDQRKADIEAT